MDRTGHMLDQRYRLGRILGQGGMASVHLAEDTKLGKAVAVKVLDHKYALQPKVVQRFTQEARAISKVRHPNVVDVTDHGVTPDRSVYLVMELLRGEDLAATLEREGPMPWARLGPIVLQICAALATVHRAGIIHRDIKPSNCFRIRAAGNPDFIKVLDFGIAKVLDGPAAPGAPQSTTGSLLGTPEYMAPELPRGLRPDARVDIYAVGVLMYKMLTGSAPFTAEVYMAVLAKHMFDPVEPPRERAPECDISPEVEAVVLKALAKERDDRWPSMVALADAVAATLPGQPSATHWLDASREGPAMVVASSEGTVIVREATPGADLDQAETNPRLGPDTLAQPRRRRVPVRLLAAVGGVGAAVVAAAVWWPGARPEPPAGIAEASGVTVGTGSKGQVPDVPRVGAPVQPAPVAAAGSGAVTTAGATPAAPVSVGAIGSGAVTTAGPAPPAGDVAPGTGPEGQVEAARAQPSFDVAAATATLQGLGKPLRKCAAEHAMIGGFTLTVKVDRRGQVIGVEGPSGARRIDDRALGCMRGLIGAQTFPASARGGTVRVDFSA